MEKPYILGPIHDVAITTLKRIPDERGSIYHMLKRTDNCFRDFGEIYFSLIHPGAIKGWHLHKQMTLNYAVPYGKIKLVLYDGREDSPTYRNLFEYFLGADNYALVTIPSHIWNGFKGIGTTDTLVADCATHPHDPSEIVRMDPFSPVIGYDWGIKHR